MSDNLFDEIEKETTGQQTVDNEDASIAQEIASAASSEPNDETFDYNALPDEPGVKYERTNLDGQTVTIKSAVLETPKKDSEFEKPLKEGGVLYKKYNFKISFDTPNNDRESLSGVKGFKRDDGSLGQPTIDTRDIADNQASRLWKVYKTYVIKSGVTKEEFEEKYGLKKFMAFLNSNPKAIIKQVPYKWNGQTTLKNNVVEFI